jgi:WbqC-like protein family
VFGENMKKVAILQSCYIPWKGYFDLIHRVDEFILYDDMQYTKRDWRNRNLIKTPNGLQWLTIPVEVKGKYLQKINETKISDTTWAKKHWQTLIANYSRSKYFEQYEEYFKKLYTECDNEVYLSQINYKFLLAICSILKINTPIRWSTDFAIADHLHKTDRLVALCQATNATHYISGPSAQAYIDTDLFAQANIGLSYINYANYPIYDQLYGDFEHTTSIVDLIFNIGENADAYFKSLSREVEA